MPNLNVENKADKTKTTQEHIEQILNQLLRDYQQTKAERNQVALWEESQEFTILGIIEIFTDEIRGYAFQSLNNNQLESETAIIKALQKLKLFEIPYFSQWYFSSESDYPHTTHYVQTLNYLRLLVIEYLSDKQA